MLMFNNKKIYLFNTTNIIFLISAFIYSLNKYINKNLYKLVLRLYLRLKINITRKFFIYS